MNTTKVDLLLAILDIDFELDIIEKFLGDWNTLCNKKHFLMEDLLDDKKRLKLGKKNKEIIDFYDTNKDILFAYKNKEVLKKVMYCSEVYYYWEDLLKKILQKVKVSGKEKAIKVLKVFKENGYNEITFCENRDFLEKIYYETNEKLTFINKQEIKYYFSDGEKRYLAKLYRNVYPVIFENANVVFCFKYNKLFSCFSENEVYLYDFEINEDNISFIQNKEKVETLIPNERIEKITKLCRYIRNLDKMIYYYERNIDILNEQDEEKIEKADVFFDIEQEFEFFRKRIKETKEKRNSLIEKAKEHDIREKDIKTSLYYFNINL